MEAEGLAPPLPVTVAEGAVAVPAVVPAEAAVLLCDPRERVVHTEVRGVVSLCGLTPFFSSSCPSQRTSLSLTPPPPPSHLPYV